MDGGRAHRSHRARERVGGALHAPVGVEQARRVQRTRIGARRVREAGEAVVEQLAVRIQEHGYRVVRRRHAGVAGRAEAQVAREADHLRAPLAGDRRAVVVRAAVDHDELRPFRELRVDGAQQRRELGGGVVQHDDDRVGHGGGP